MKQYKNLAGDSGAIAYDVGNDRIKVKFLDGTVYTYTYRSAGRANVETMKSLAIAGRGLSSFISSIVKDGFASKSGWRSK